MVYLQVAENMDAEAIEMPTETDDTLLLSTLSAQFPDASGLKFRNQESGGMRAVRLADGHFHAPEKDGWGDHIYYCVLHKVDNKRKGDSDDEEGSKNKRFENKLNQKCSDLVVLDLPWKTTEEEMREYFEGFGDVVLAQVKKDLKTGQSKGYGFIRYSNYESQIRVLGQRHFIQGRWCDVKIPNSKESQQTNVSPKIHVGRLTEEITADVLREYFSKFGEVTHVFTPKPYRGFAFVTFMHADVAEALCGEDHIIKGASVVISAVVPKPDSRGDSPRRQDNYERTESSSREQNRGMQGSTDFQSIRNASRWNGGRGGGGGGINLAQVVNSGGVGVGNGSGSDEGMMNSVLGNLNLSPQLNQAIVSAILNQAVAGFTGAGGMQGQDQGPMGSPQQHQQQGGGRSSSPQNYGKPPSTGFGFGYQTAHGSQGRLHGREA